MPLVSPHPTAGSEWYTAAVEGGLVGALAWAVAEVGAADIDRIAIHRASLESMRRAVMCLSPRPDAVLVDAFTIPGLPVAQRQRRLAAQIQAPDAAALDPDRILARAA